MSTKTAREADKFVVRLPDGMRAEVEAASAKQFTSMNTFFLQAAREKLDRDKRQDLLLDALVAQVEAGKPSPALAEA